MLTAGKDYGVRVILAYEHRKVGDKFFPPGVLREMLIRRGLVEPVQPPEEPKETLGDLLPRRRRAADK
jgi:hypothetical protein